MRTVQAIIYAKVSFTDDELDAFRDEAKANNEPYEDEKDAIYALALCKLPDIDGNGVKARNTIVDLSTLSHS